MEFKELTDQPKGGRLPIDARKILNGILYVLVTGCRWSEQHGGG